jgi:hypothetical protein
MYCLLMKAIFVHGYRVQWFDGSDLFGQLRHAAGAGSIEQKIEQLKPKDKDARTIQEKKLFIINFHFLKNGRNF